MYTPYLVISRKDIALKLIKAEQGESLNAAGHTVASPDSPKERFKMYTVTYIGTRGCLFQKEAETLYEARMIARSQRFGFMSIKDADGYEIYNIIRDNDFNGCLEFALVCKE